MLQTTATVLKYLDLLLKPSPEKNTLCLIPMSRFGTNKAILSGAIGLSIALKDMSQRIDYSQFFSVYGIIIVGGFAIRVAFS